MPRPEFQENVSCFLSLNTTNKNNGKYQHRMKLLLESEHLPLNYFSNAVTYSPVPGGYNGSPEELFVQWCQEIIPLIPVGLLLVHVIKVVDCIAGAGQAMGIWHLLKEKGN